MKDKKHKIQYEGKEIEFDISHEPFVYTDKLKALIEKYSDKMDEFFFCARIGSETIGFRKGKMGMDMVDLYDYMVENSMAQKEL